MASINIKAGSDGKPRYIVNYQEFQHRHGRQRRFMSIDEACGFFYEVEASAITCRTVDSIRAAQDWSFQKLVWFYLGYQLHRLNGGQIKHTSYVKCRYDLIAIRGDILQRRLAQVSGREASQALTRAGQVWMRAAYSLLMRLGVIQVNPMQRPRKIPRKPLNIPSREAVRGLLRDAERRERIAVYLGAFCGLRIGEALAVQYNDIGTNYIDVRRHLTANGVQDGLKHGVQRRVKLPDGLRELLDVTQLGGKSSRRLLASHTHGTGLSLNYAGKGALRDLLTAHGVRRFHDLRHFAVSVLAAKGVDVLRISRYIGHKNTAETLRVYGHLFDEFESVSIDLDD